MNAKLERTIADIGKTEAKISELQEKLRALKQQKIELENIEIVALFRKEKFSEDDFIEYIKSRREARPDGGESQSDPDAFIAGKETIYNED